MLLTAKAGPAESRNREVDELSPAHPRGTTVAGCWIACGMGGRKRRSEKGVHFDPSDMNIS